MAHGEGGMAHGEGGMAHGEGGMTHGEEGRESDERKGPNVAGETKFHRDHSLSAHWIMVHY
jgi:hypothetical protein